jgi:hypothetical protein
MRGRPHPIYGRFRRHCGGHHCALLGGLLGSPLRDICRGCSAIEYDAGRAAGIGKDKISPVSRGACRHQSRQRSRARQSSGHDAQLGRADRALSPLQNQAGIGGSGRAAKRCLRPHQGLRDRASRRTMIGGRRRESAAAGANRWPRAMIAGCELECGKILIRRSSGPYGHYTVE